MRKTFQTSGFAVNKRGNTVGIHYTLTARCRDSARAEAIRQASENGYQHARITLIREIRA
ncbi:hypothetical protein GJV07_23245 [Enterobacteriaceae bacterium RIT711]|nr:hypothetical protein [Enterobacteriaceae bacterium RIT711]